MLRRIFGIVFLCFSVFLSVSILTYSHLDDSFLHASVGNDQVRDTKNLFGTYGAYIADIFLKSIGYSTLFVILFFFIDGIRFLKKKAQPFFIQRLSLLLICIPILSIFLSSINTDDIKILHYNDQDWGGFLGYYWLSEMSIAFSLNNLRLFFGVLSGIFILFALGFTSYQYLRFIILCFRSFITTLFVIFVFIKRVFALQISSFKNAKQKANYKDIHNQEENEEFRENFSKKITIFQKLFSNFSFNKFSSKDKYSKQDYSENLGGRYDDKLIRLNLDNNDDNDDNDEKDKNTVYDNHQEHNQLSSNLLNKKNNILINDSFFSNKETVRANERNLENFYQKADNDNGDFILPSTTLLHAHKNNENSSNSLSHQVLRENAETLMSVLKDFGVRGKIHAIHPGPVVTLYELQPAAGTKSSRVIGLADDIARSMSALSARISVIPGKNAIGIELPNKDRETVYLREVLEDSAYAKSHGVLPLALGKNIGGDSIIADLAKMPHLLVAGTTGSGKSVAINTMILSLLYKYTPKDCKLIMIDPKMLELSIYDGIPHLIAPVVVNPKKAICALKWAVKEMESRYRAMSTLGVRNISGYNAIVQHAIDNNQEIEKQIQTGFDNKTGRPVFEVVNIAKEKLPYIVVIVDEMADLMLVAGKDIEAYIQRLAQMARAAGIHLIMATQRPSVDVITGVIKANFPTRISFQVTSKIDSRTILGEQGAEQLLGMGDMLYMMPGGRIERVHGPFVSDKEVRDVVDFIKNQSGPQYMEDFIKEIEEDSDGGIQGIKGAYGSTAFDNLGSVFGGQNSDDELYRQAVALVLKDKRPTTSYLQRCFKIGYNKAALLIERMEQEGILSAPNNAGKRDILIEE